MTLNEITPMSKLYVHIIHQWSIADLEQLLEEMSGLKQSVGRICIAQIVYNKICNVFIAASLFKSASEKLDHFCSELGRPLPPVAAIGPSSSMGDDMLGRRRSAQVAESTFPRKVKRLLHHICMNYYLVLSLNLRAAGQEGWAANEETQGRRSC